MAETTTQPLNIGVTGRSWLLNPFVSEAIKIYGKKARFHDRTARFLSARDVELQLAASGRADPRGAVRRLKLPPVDVMVQFKDQPSSSGREEHVALVTVSGPRRRQKKLRLRFGGGAQTSARFDAGREFTRLTRAIIAAIGQVRA